MPTRRVRKGTNLGDVLEINRSLVLRLLRRDQSCSRVQLAHALGLRQSTVTKIVHDLMAWNLVTETGIIQGRKGRRSISISLNDKVYRVIGVRLSRKSVSAGLFALDGAVITTEQEPIEVLAGHRQALEAMKRIVARLLDHCGEGQVIGIGVATPGPLYRHEGRIALITNFPGWEKVSLPEELEAAFHLPVFIEHDANAAALAEWCFGPYSRLEGTMIYVAAGQGIGSGIIMDGLLYQGKLGTAGEIGHMSISFDGPRCECGNRGCLELYCSTTALVREVRAGLAAQPDSRMAGASTLTPRAIFAAAANGDTLAREAVERAAWFLGFGLVGVINAYNPQIIVIGDELAEAGPALLGGIRKVVKEHTLASIYDDLRIELTTFTTDPVLMGASALAAEEVLSRPSSLKNRIG